MPLGRQHIATWSISDQARIQGGEYLFESFNRRLMTLSSSSCLKSGANPSSTPDPNFGGSTASGGTVKMPAPTNSAANHPVANAPCVVLAFLFVDPI